MALRDLVMGGRGCSVPGTSMRPGSANPLSALTDSILNSASKTQDTVRELPGFAGPSGASNLPLNLDRQLVPVGLPGQHSHPLDFGSQPDAYAQEFMGQFHDVDRGMDRGMENAWQDATQMPPSSFREQMFRQHRPDAGEAAAFAQFENFYGPQAANGGMAGPVPFAGSPQQIIGQTLHTFFDLRRGDMPISTARLPELGLSVLDKQRIRDRSSIMARHVFADKGEAYVNSQVSALLQSLEIEENGRIAGPMGGRFSEYEDYWSQANGLEAKIRAQQGGEWAQEFGKHMEAGPSGWADEFGQEMKGENWAGEFHERWGQEGLTSDQRRARDQNGHNQAMQQTKQLVDTLSQDSNPKMQNSKFLQFVSKMSRGELIVEDNTVKPVASSGADQWANEFERLNLRTEGEPERWANEFAGQHLQDGSWAQEFVRGQNNSMPTHDQWAEEFQTGTGRDWAEEFGDQTGNMNDSSGWLDSYNKFVEDQLRGEAKMPASQRWLYQFSDSNPYVGHPSPMKEGQDLFRRGLLSEAVLALEAEVLRNEQNSEAWRLLGIAHAENDDDRQAIAAMVRARDADPSNLEVLLALGVSHTNELEQTEALSYLRGWIQHHPKYQALISTENAERLTHSEVTSLFMEAAKLAPEDADVHTVLGVLFNLSREYDRAIEAFRRALALRPQDYSLWNKLGATQANSTHSAEAIQAYQKALDLKANYVRAWSNMGIGFANQGLYEESIRYYVRALAMNPRADNAWQYLRISLSCAGRTDLLGACDQRELEVLNKEYPL